MNNILVVGDSCLDTYYELEDAGESPEHPVRKYRTTSVTHQPGMAANVAMAVKALGSNVTLATKMGRDEARYILEDILNMNGVGVMHTTSGNPTTTEKVRLVDKKLGHLLRHDKDYNQSFSRSDWVNITTQASLASAVLISDYNKGCITEDFLYLLRHQRDKLYLDPHPGQPLSTYTNNGAYVVKVNQREFDTFGPGIFKKARYTIVTHGEKGSTCWENGDAIYTTPPVKVEVKDVCGAGDTYIAALAVSHGRSIKDQMDYATAMAAKAVASPFTTAFF